MQKKRAFTMVELIFVIVILGILAAVAVPKLNASREDAEITKFATNLATIYKDVQTYYLANGKVLDDGVSRGTCASFAKATNVPLVTYDGSYCGLQIDGKHCLLIWLNKDPKYGEFIAIRHNKEVDNANPMCAKMWDVFAAKPELKALLDGQNGLADKKIINIARVNSDNWCYRPIVKYDEGVQFD